MNVQIQSKTYSSISEYLISVGVVLSLSSLVPLPNNILNTIFLKAKLNILASASLHSRYHQTLLGNNSAILLTVPFRLHMQTVLLPNCNCYCCVSKLNLLHVNS